MKDDIDIEGALNNYSPAPGDGVKQSVMSRFKQKRRPRRGANGTAGVWKKPVPLYVFAASVLLAVGLSFFAGAKFYPGSRQADPGGSPVRSETVVDAQAIEWQTAPNDVL